MFGSAGLEGPIRGPWQCSPGKWIADRTRGKGPYAHLPGARGLERRHVRVHHEANELLDMHKAEHTQEALAKLAALQTIADGIGTLLQTMEAPLRTGV